MYHFRIDPMPQHQNKAMGDPSTRFMVLMVHVPASYIDWSKAKIMGRSLTAEEATELEEKLDKQFNQK